MKKTYLSIICGMAAALTASAVPVAITNPGFESDVVVGSVVKALGDTSITGWTINTAPVTHVNGGAAEGAQFIILNSSAPSSVSQNITIPFTGYLTVAFKMLAAAGGPATQPAAVGVFIGATPVLQSTSVSLGDGWVQKFLVFENVPAGVHPLVFASEVNGSPGPGIDAVWADISVGDGGGTLVALGAALVGLDRLRRSRKA